MRPAYIGIDVAIAKNKVLPIAICTWNNGRFVPEAVRQLPLMPPRGMGNAATLDDTAVKRFVRDARTYIMAACARLALVPTRIGIDAPSAQRRPELARRRAEAALDQAGISCFATPSEAEFSSILGKVARHLEGGGREDRIPHANQLWMRVGFALFAELSQLAPCLEIFPQATARIIGSGSIHKSQPGAVAVQLAAATGFTGWPVQDGDAPLAAIAWGASHDQLDAYLCAWVAGLDDDNVEAESLYEAAVLGIRRLNEDPWLEKIGPATVLEIEVRHPGTTHAISLQQVERWLAGATTNPNEASKKVKLKMLLMKG